MSAKDPNAERGPSTTGESSGDVRRREFLRRVAALGLARVSISVCLAAPALSENGTGCGRDDGFGGVYSDSNCNRKDPIKGGHIEDLDCGETASATNDNWSDEDCDSPVVKDPDSMLAGDWHGDNDCGKSEGPGTHQDSDCAQHASAGGEALRADDDCQQTSNKGAVHKDSDCGVLKASSGGETFDDSDCGKAGSLGGTVTASDDQCGQTMGEGSSDKYSDDDCGIETDEGSGLHHTDTDCGQNHEGGNKHEDSDCGKLVPGSSTKSTDEDCGLWGQPCPSNDLDWPRHDDSDCGNSTDPMDPDAAVQMDDDCGKSKVLGGQEVFEDDDCGMSQGPTKEPHKDDACGRDEECSGHDLA